MSKNHTTGSSNYKTNHTTAPSTSQTSCAASKTSHVAVTHSRSDSSNAGSRADSDTVKSSTSTSEDNSCTTGGLMNSSQVTSLIVPSSKAGIAISSDNNTIPPPAPAPPTPHTGTATSIDEVNASPMIPSTKTHTSSNELIPSPISHSFTTADSHIASSTHHSPTSRVITTSTSVGPVVVSSSPVKTDNDNWISHLDLYMNDKAILESTRWLNDGIMFAAQSLLKGQSKGKIFGWKSTQCSKMEKFPPLPTSSCRFIQILNVANTHWIVASNVNVHTDSYYQDSVCIYDSGVFPVSDTIKKTICQFLKPTPDVFSFDLMNIQPQTNGNDCGLFAVACATELVHGFDPVSCHWDTPKMRQHLLVSLEKGYLDRFPCIKRKRTRFGCRVRKSIKETLYCTCRMPNDKSKPMIFCDQCRKWFHKQCEGLNPSESFKGIKWSCQECKRLLNSITR